MDRAQTFLSNMDHTIFFGVNDLQTANAVSERLGMSTVPVWSENGGRSRNRNHGEMGQSSSSASSNDGYSISETGRKLLTPDEVMNLGERQAIVFTPGARPFIARLVRYYEREFRSVPGRRRVRRIKPRLPKPDLRVGHRGYRRRRHCMDRR